MKTNSNLQVSLNCFHASQLVWYSGHVLASATLNSPATTVRSAIPAVAGKAAIAYQPAHPAYPARPLRLAMNNTAGYIFGELYLNSPAYPPNVNIPAIPAKPATAEVVAKPAVIAQSAIAAVSVPAIQALKGWEDAIDIVQTVDLLTVTAELPVFANVGIVGSDKVIIGEITPSALQATAWLDELGAPNGNGTSLNDPAIPILEQFFYKYALQCEHTITDTNRIVNGISIPCKKIEVKLYPLAGFDPMSNSLQLSKIRNSANVGS